ncbi:unknown [Acholeplasma sp. CAG:878]|nr:unknown [Acholeplasma sp. CAG:878]
MKNEKEIELLNIDIATALMFIVTIIISIYLTYENRQDLLNRKRILNKKDDQYILLFNRLLVLIIVLIILYDNIEGYEIAKEKNKDLKPFKIQIFASILTVITALLVLYVVFYNWDNNSLSDIENPIF